MPNLRLGIAKRWTMLYHFWEGANDAAARNKMLPGGNPLGFESEIILTPSS